MRQKILLVIRAAVSLLLMAALIYMVRDSIPKMCYTVKHLPLSILLFGLFLFFLSIFIVSFRLKLLLATQDIFLNTTDIAKLTFISYFFSSFLPTSIGGDVVKAFYISKISNKTMQSYASVFIDRFLGMAAIFLIAACTFFYSKEMSKSHPRWLLPLLLIASVLFLIFLFNKRLTKMFAFFIVPFVTEKAKAKFRNMYDSIHDFAKYKFQMIECILISIIGQVSAFLLFISMCSD